MPVPDVSDRPIAQLTSLAGRRAVVTGGARGIGEAIARRFAEAGAAVAVADLDKALAEEVAADIGAELSVRTIGMELDVADPTSTYAVAERTALELGGLDIWVNNAGIFPTTPVMEMGEDDWDRVVDVNLKGAFLGAKAAAERMIDAATGGVIVNIASTAGFRAAGPGLAHYVSSKHGMIGLTKSLALELGTHGIRVLAIAPTLVQTPGIDANMAQFEESGLGDVIAGFAQRLPLGRVGVADDVARIALFCASDLAMFMTGSCLAADAGDLCV